MKLSAVKRLVEETFAVHLNDWGYARDPKLHEFYTKKRSEHLTSGILPRLFTNRGILQLELVFGTLYLPIEKVIDSFDGSSLRQDQNYPNWTFTANNERKARFPEEFFSTKTVDKSSGFTVTTFFYNNVFRTSMAEQSIVDKVTTNLDALLKYGIPWLESINTLDEVLMEVDSNGEGARRMVARYLSNDFAKVVALVNNYRLSSPIFTNHPFCDALLEAAENKKLELESTLLAGIAEDIERIYREKKSDI